MGNEYWKENFTLYKRIVEKLYDDGKFDRDKGFAVNEDIVYRTEKLLDFYKDEDEEILNIKNEIGEIIEKIKVKYFPVKELE